ncbi:MAG: hypothetical protein IPM53_27045 [Anaerolineaceae bacterium]|nr:hypothetical protein [Anaerolineaceae bacterium]
METWKQDVDWWDMLIQAQAGDVLLTNGGYYVFDGEGKYFLGGINFGYSDGGYSTTYAGSDLYDVSLNELFNKKDGKIWGGLIQYNEDGTLLNILYRISTFSEITEDAQYLPGVVKGGATLGANGLCSVLGGPGPTCAGVVRGAINGGEWALNPRNLQEGDQIFSYMGHSTIIHTTRITRFSMGEQANVTSVNLRYFGPADIKPQIDVECVWNGDSYSCQ